MDDDDSSKPTKQKPKSAPAETTKTTSEKEDNAEVKKKLVVSFCKNPSQNSSYKKIHFSSKRKRNQKISSPKKTNQVQQSQPNPANTRR